MVKGAYTDEELIEQTEDLAHKIGKALGYSVKRSHKLHGSPNASHKKLFNAAVIAQEELCGHYVNEALLRHYTKNKPKK